jgi:hypothetical protein
METNNNYSELRKELRISREHVDSARRDYLMYANIFGVDSDEVDCKRDAAVDAYLDYLDLYISVNTDEYIAHNTEDVLE